MTAGTVVGVSSSSSLPPAQSVPSPPPPMKPFLLHPPRRKFTTKQRRLLASTLVLVASIVLAVSMAVSWWGASSIGHGASEVIGFLPGSSYSFSTSGAAGATAGSQAYAAEGLIHIGQLYEAVLGLVLLASLAGFAGMFLGYLGAFGSFRSRIWMRITLILTFVSFLGAVGLPILVAADQPSAFTADGAAIGAPGGSGCGTGTNPCNSFWGSASAGGINTSWGADIGWYLAVAAAVLLLLALIQLLMTRSQPYTRDEVWAASPQGPPPSAAVAPSSAPAPTPASGAVSAAPQAPGAYCPRCGNPMTWVPQYSRYYCLNERTYV